MFSVVLLAFASVMVWGGLVVFMLAWKVRFVGEMVTGAATPVPARPTVWGLLLALSVMVSEALRDPVAIGAKVTSIVQLVPAETPLPQLLV